MVERIHGKDEVTGSIPVVGSREITNRKDKMAKKGPRKIITLECKECKERNYTTKKNDRNTTDKLELNKYCKRDKKHTVHKEIK